MKKILFPILLILLIPNIAFAFEKRSGNLVNIPADEVVEGSLFIQADKIEIEGLVNGDVFCFSPEVKISGKINGDILCAGESFDFTGTSTGNLRLLFAKTKIDGRVAKNVNALTDDITLLDKTRISGELFLLANKADIAGEINRDLFGVVQTAKISSFVGGDISLRREKGVFSSTNEDNFRLLRGATVLGNLNYKSNKDLEKEDGVVIKGEENKTITEKGEKTYSSNLIWPLISIFANILISLVLISLFKNYLLSILKVIKTESTKAVFIGSLALILSPLSIFLVFLTIIGIPLSLLLLFVLGIIILINKSIVSIMLGGEILRLSKIKKTSLNKQAVIGAVIFYLIVQIPFVGSFFSFASMIIVLGAIIQNFRTKLNNKIV